MRRRLLWLIAGLGLTSPARADTCGPVPGFEAVFPVPDSTRIPPNAKIRVRYPVGQVREVPIDVTADGEPVPGVTCPFDPSCPGSAAVGNRELTFEPALSFLPQSATIRATATDTDGRSFDWTFETSADRDTEPPVVEPAQDISWAWLGGGPDDDPCGPEGLVRFQVSVDLPPAQGEIDRENVEYEVFRTNGPDADLGPVLDGIALDDGLGDVVEARVYLPAEGGYARKLCFSVGALDLAGNFTPGQNEQCARLEEGPFFRSICSASPGRGRADGAIATLAGLAIAIGWRRR